jgi:peptidyl-prolyl cis-trans isomerase A (cyclophilin A)
VRDALVKHHFRWAHTAALASVILLAASPAAARAQARPVRIEIETSLGKIEAELDSVHAPVSVRNFLAYVDSGLYANGQFHRTVRADNQPNNPVKITVIQAGQDPARRAEHFPAIELERTSVTGLHHLDGTLSMARSGPNTATSDFFICIGPQPELDFGGKRNADGQGFAVFGRVTSGMDVVRAINAAPADANQRLTPPITITRIRRVR